ncbi:MAG: DUF2723 domain-containing protein [Prevotella sp.]|nr:DUF2723 domain-containing protein [Prevotella sp.]
MKKYRLVDNILGWVAFAIAAIVYCSTIEPTASFWDCPEFIATGYKLEVGHPPGAPFFMLTANLFSQFVSDPSQVARMVNIMSALLSATCILFLFWSITHLTRKLLIDKWDELTTSKMIAIEASGLVGALIYTFSDTFWFSAVEGEVYAYSSAFTAIVFWLILKWEDHADEPHSDRWLLLITYMTGLSIGVHLLNLLCLPAIVLVYYFKRFPNADLRGSLIALLISFFLVAVILYGVVPGIVTVGGWFELFFVNTLHMKFNTGLIIYIFLLVAAVLWAIYESYHDRSVLRQNISFLLAVAMVGIPFYSYGWKAFIIGIIVLAIIWFVLQFKRGGKQLVTARIKNTVSLCLLMLMIGYSTYAVIVIRSSANPPMDQNSPEDIFTLGSYLSRDQYGDRPLIYGQAYSSQVLFERDGDYCKPHSVKGAPIYQQKEKASADEKDSYFVVRNKIDYKYAQNMLFPRMHDSGHAQAYESWMSGAPSWLPSGYDVPYDRCGEMLSVHMPSQLQNIYFFLSYQCNFMYWRYFMWNFAGRQNDIQGNGELEHGNWLTGIPFIDNARLGNQEKLPDELKNNKGHNVFYCLPLLLGLIGLFWQAYKGQKGIRQFWVVCFLFLMTGLAIVFYLNQTPMQPRERDYAYAGSFYAFAIWCGMGVAAIIDYLKKYIKVDAKILATAVGVISLLVPIQMASQTWDDHDRSGRYTCRDFGQNYLMSMQDEGNPIIFTNGDNDTFPLWYNQEVEGVRTDARVCNLSYLQTDWYIDQMCRPAYDSPSMPITWPRLDYCSGTNEYVEVDPSYKQQIMEFYQENPETAKEQFGEEPFELKNILRYWVRSKNPDLHFIPTDTVYVTIDKEAVKKSGMMMAADTIPEKMVISLKGKRNLYKQDLMMLELIANSNWTRPIYVALTVGSENYMNLGDNFVQEGLVNRITPFTTNAIGAKKFDTEKVYKNLMTRFKYGGLDKKGLYIDETVMRMCYTHRRLFGTLASNLVTEGKNEQALKALEYAEKVIPEYNVPMNYMSGALEFAKVYGTLGKKDKAKHVIDQLFNNASQYMNWYTSLDDHQMRGYQQECMLHLYIMQNCIELADLVDEKYVDTLYKKYVPIQQLYIQKGGHMPYSDVEGDD